MIDGWLRGVGWMEKMMGGGDGGKGRMYMINISVLNILFNFVDKRG